jgi:hypothetical protein
MPCSEDCKTLLDSDRLVPALLDVRGRRRRQAASYMNSGTHADASLFFHSPGPKRIVREISLELI